MDLEDIARLCEMLTTSEEGVSEARIDPKLHEMGMQKISLSLVGKIIANREVNKEAFKGTIPKIWRIVKEMGVKSIAVNIYIFRFKCARDRKRILEGGLWCFDKQLIVLQEAEGLGKLSDADFKYFPIWDVGSFLGGMVGLVKEVDTRESGECSGSFIRVRVLLDVSKPLTRSLRVRLEDDSYCSVVVCYEWLPNFCYCCGRIGHLIRECCDNAKSVVEGPDIKFEAWLRAPVGSKAAGVKGSFESDRGTNVMSKEAKEKSEERREAPVVVVGSTSIKDRVMEELILHLNNNYLLVGEKGGDTVCEPDPLREVVRALFEVEMVINSNSLCSEMNGMDRGVLRDTGQGVKGKGQVLGDQSSVCHKLDDEGEVSCPKNRKWKRMAGSQGLKVGGGQNSSLKQKRELCFDFEDGQHVKKGRTEVNMSDTAAVARIQHRCQQ
ncbi:hypothetical protein ACOSQ2_018457 [Xanthoceras sorbifolium]